MAEINQQADCMVLVVSAGRGHRFGGETPKQYLKIAGRSLLAHSIISLQNHPRVSDIRVVIHPDDQKLYSDAIAGLEILPPVYGGAERQDSVRLGLDSIVEYAPKYVLIHDAVRPFVKLPLLDNLLAELDSGKQAIIPGLAIADTLKRAIKNSEGLQIADTVDRTNLWRAQTPQAFDFKSILEAHESHSGKTMTDDSSIAEAAGLKVGIIAGDENNFKITTPDDFKRGERIIDVRNGSSSGMTNIGTGFDVHRFKDGTSVILCGVEVPHDKSLEGHSDADVAMHAVTDALLGAVGAGDIGLFFPPSDPQWKDVSSDVFLSRAGKEISDRGGKINNIDITIICEAPKIGPYREQMQKSIATILNISTQQVNIKGTTTEMLGFTGRREGIAAQAAASVSI